MTALDTVAAHWPRVNELLDQALAMPPEGRARWIDALDGEAPGIQQSLREIFAGRTVAVIAYRISSVRDCDQIAVLEGGRITELGSHKELLLQGGFYARLARQQALEEELEEMGAVA